MVMSQVTLIFMPMSNLRNAICSVTIVSVHVDEPHVACRFLGKGHVAVSNVGVKSHHCADD